MTKKLNKALGNPIAKGQLIGDFKTMLIMMALGNKSTSHFSNN